MNTDKIRKEEKPPFAMISNEFLSDKSISFKAKGIFSFMYSKPSNWNFTIKSMASQSKDGQRSIMAAIQELKDAGYVTYFKNPDGTGVYKLYIKPNLQNSNMADPNLQNPNLGFSNMLKEQCISNTDITKNKEESKKDGTDIDFDKLRIFFNEMFGRKARVFSTVTKNNFKGRIKEGYLKEDIVRVFKNVKASDWHKNINYDAVSPEFLSRSKTFENYASKEPEKEKPKDGHRNF